MQCNLNIGETSAIERHCSKWNVHDHTIEDDLGVEHLEPDCESCHDCCDINNTDFPAAATHLWTYHRLNYSAERNNKLSCATITITTLPSDKLPVT